MYILNRSSLPSDVKNHELGASSVSLVFGGRLSFNMNRSAWPGLTASEGSWTFAADLGNFGSLAIAAFCTTGPSTVSTVSASKRGSYQRNKKVY